MRYTRHFAQKYPVPCIALDSHGDTPLEGEALETVLTRYKHPFSATIGDEAHRKGLPNEMNYVMDYRLIYCLRNGLPLDMDVYDAAEWSCITELSEKSVLNGSIPVEIPDFTRGVWKKHNIRFYLFTPINYKKTHENIPIIKDMLTICTFTLRKQHCSKQDYFRI